MDNIVKFNERALGFLSKVKTDLAQTSTMDGVKGYRDRAEALRVFFQNSKKGIEIQNFYAEVRIRAERRGGEILHDMRKNNELEGQGGDRKSKSNGGTLKTLDDLGISKNESSRYQKIAEIPEETFEEKIKNTKDQNLELTTALFLGLSKRLSQEQKEKDKTTEFKLFLRKAWMRSESLSEQIGDLLERKKELRSAAIWDSDDRKDLHRALGNLLGPIVKQLLKEFEAIEESKAKEPKKVDPILEKKIKSIDLKELDACVEKGIRCVERTTGIPFPELVARNAAKENAKEQS